MHEDLCAGIHFKSFTWIPGRKLLNCIRAYLISLETAKTNFQSCCTWRLFLLSWPKIHSDFSKRCYRKTWADFLANSMYVLCVFHSVSNFLVLLMFYCWFLFVCFCFLLNHILDFLKFIMSIYLFIFISWRLITLQYCSGFCHT